MNSDNLKAALMKKNYKITKQREIIFNALLNNRESHLSPEELHAIVNEEHKDIGIATVYRTLLLFEELGLVFKLNFDDNRYRYELSSEKEQHHHHHLICKECNKIQEVKFDLLESIEDIIEKTYGFKIDNHILKFYGICSECQQKKKGSKEVYGNKKTE